MYKKIAIIALLGIVFIGIAYAYPGRNAGFQDRNYVDEDGDGICDNYQSGQCHGYGKGFVDEDGDGICDYCQGSCNQGHHHGHGRGRGRP